MRYVLNNCGHVSGNARNYAGYRHIALMEGELQPYIRNTRKARVVQDATVYVGSTMRSAGYRMLREFEAMAKGGQ